MSALKDLYSPEFYAELSSILEIILPSFDKTGFINQIFTSDFERKELKERIYHTSETVHRFIPADFAQATPLLLRLTDEVHRRNTPENLLPYLFLPDYVERYGLDNFELSMQVIEHITQLVSCEFAVRPFILRYRELMLAQMLRWADHKSASVRRLASEGSRPRLPWAMALPFLKTDPSPILPILEKLKTDPDECVRRSVANNLNDIAKDHPDLVVQIARRWHGKSKNLDAVVKHGCRTLLKQGHAELLTLYALNSSKISLAEFEIHTPTVKIGDRLDFSFHIANIDNSTQNARLEYGIYYLKANGQLSPKIFKISEKTLKTGENVPVKRSHSFRVITTRVFYTGRHELAIIINGEEKARREFWLK